MSHQNAATAYATMTQTMASPRSAELQAFLRVNGRLMAARNNPEIAFTDLADAIHMNTRLWTILATDVASEGNTLPDALRAQIVSLALYSQKTGRAVLRGEAELNDLIDVNSAITNGLSGKSGTEVPVQGAA